MLDTEVARKIVKETVVSRITSYNVCYTKLLRMKSQPILLQLKELIVLVKKNTFQLILV